jgi:hypothetical protein
MSQLITQIRFGNLSFFSLPINAQRAILDKDKSVSKEFRLLLYKCLQDGWYYHACELFPNIPSWNERHPMLSIKMCNNLSVAAQIIDTTGVHQQSIYETLVEFTILITKEVMRFDFSTADEDAINDNFLVSHVDSSPQYSVPSYPNAQPALPNPNMFSAPQEFTQFKIGMDQSNMYNSVMLPQTNMSVATPPKKSVDPTSHLLYSVAQPTQQVVQDVDHSRLLTQLCRAHYEKTSKSWKSAIQQCYVEAVVHAVFPERLQLQDYLIIRFANANGKGFACFELKNNYATIICSSCDITSGNVYFYSDYLKIGNILLKQNKSGTINGFSSCWTDFTIVKK